MDVLNFDGPFVDAFSCNGQDNQAWQWDMTDGTLRSVRKGQCLSVRGDLEVWAGPLADGSQAVVLLNRGDVGSESMTAKWTDIGFPSDRSAVVRDLWAHKDLGTFMDNYTSPMIDAHAVMMLRITLIK